MKLAARKLFQQAYKTPYLPAISTIKMMFPVFDPKNPVHWANLMDKCNAEIQKEEDAKAEVTPIEELRIESIKLQQLGCKVTYKATAYEYDYYVSYKGIGLGNFGYNYQDKNYYTTTSRGNQIVSGLKNARHCVAQLLHMNRYNVSIAA